MQPVSTQLACQLARLLSEVGYICKPSIQTQEIVPVCCVCVCVARVDTTQLACQLAQLLWLLMEATTPTGEMCAL